MVCTAKLYRRPGSFYYGTIAHPHWAYQSGVAQNRVERTVLLRFSLDETWDVGEDTGTPIEFTVYDVPFRFDGELKKVSVDLK